MTELLGPTIPGNSEITDKLNMDIDWLHNSIGLSFLQEDCDNNNIIILNDIWDWGGECGTGSFCLNLSFRELIK